MAAVVLSPEERRARSRAIQQLDAEWTAEQIAAGVDGPTPAGRKADSDYNQHVPALESDGAALDGFFDRLDEIVGPQS